MSGAFALYRAQQTALQHGLQRLETHRLGETIRNAYAMTALAIRRLQRGTQGDHRQLAAAGQCTNLTAQREAAFRHIQQYRIKRFGLQKGQCGRTVIHGFHPVTQLEQHAAHRQLAHAIVVHQQHRAILRSALREGRLPHRLWLRRHRADAHFQLETTALARFGMMGQAPTEQFNQLPANRQADTHAAVFAGGRAVELEEPLVQRGLVEEGKADTAVGHNKAQAQPAITLRHTHHAQAHSAFVGELEGVVQQAVQAVDQFVRITDHPVRQLIRHVDGKCQAFALGAALNCWRKVSSAPRRLNTCGWAVRRPACNSVRVRMPLTMRIMSRAEPAAVCWYCARSSSSGTVCISSNEPITPFIGVRSSWVRVARNSSFSRLLRANCWLSTSSFWLASNRICACCSRMPSMRSAKARESSATSMAEPSWLAYMVRNILGR